MRRVRPYAPGHSFAAPTANRRLRDDLGRQLAQVHGWVWPTHVRDTETEFSAARFGVALRVEELLERDGAIAGNERLAISIAHRLITGLRRREPVDRTH
jgi:hypothetical protein